MIDPITGAITTLIIRSVVGKVVAEQKKERARQARKEALKHEITVMAIKSGFLLLNAGIKALTNRDSQA